MAGKPFEKQGKAFLFHQSWRNRDHSIGAHNENVRVLGVIEKRVGAKLVADYLEDLTPPEEYELLRMTTAQKLSSSDRGTADET